MASNDQVLAANQAGSWRLIPAVAITSTKIQAVRGDTNRWSFAYGGTAVSAKFTVRSPSMQQVVVVKTLGSGITRSDLGFDVVLSPYDTSGLLPVLHTFLYDLEVVESSGDVVTLVSGPLYLFSDVSY